MHDDIKTVLLTKEEIDARVQEMGKQIAADYADKDLVVIVLLKGAAWFATDLTRAIDMPLRVDFMVASSYGNGTSTSGSVKVKLDVSEDIKGKDVLVIDDIIDSAGLRLLGVVPSSEELAFLSVTHRLKPNGKPMRAFKRIAERLCGENILLPQPKKI